jgi:hypothetical protein
MSARPRPGAHGATGTDEQRGNRMKRLGAIACLAGLLVIAPAAALGNGGEGLTGTAHDFTGSGRSDVRTAGNTGLCIYCHTPQSSLSTEPIWNHAPSQNYFRWDATSTFAGTPLTGFAGDVYRGASARCLSCHDGSVAVGDIALMGDGGETALSTSHMNDFAPKYQLGVGGDLSGNHPIAVPYPMGRMPNTYNGVTNGGGRGVLAFNEWQPNPTMSSTAAIRLYQEDGAGHITTLAPGMMTTTAGIECSSCHDPHNKASVDTMFLRGRRAGKSQADGYLCQQCHNM